VGEQISGRASTPSPHGAPVTTEATEAVEPVEPDFDWSWAEGDGDDTWVPPTVDITRPSVARMYDYALGGKDNYAIDREAADRAMQVLPDGPELARVNRVFLVAAVRSMARAGIRQFLDLGTGIPTSPNVHEVARELIPDARIVYVDNDPVVLAHSRAMLDGTPGVAVLTRDLRDPAAVLDDVRLRRVLSLDEPVGLLLVSVLHFVEPTIGAQAMRHYIDRLAPGSRLAFSVGTFDGVPPNVTRHLEEVYRGATAPLHFRTLAQTEEVLDGLEVLPPGIVDIARWTDPEAPMLNMRMHTGIAVKP